MLNDIYDSAKKNICTWHNFLFLPLLNCLCAPLGILQHIEHWVNHFVHKQLSHQNLKQ